VIVLVLYTTTILALCINPSSTNESTCISWNHESWWECYSKDSKTHNAQLGFIRSLAPVRTTLSMCINFQVEKRGKYLHRMLLKIIFRSYFQLVAFFDLQGRGTFRDLGQYLTNGTFRTVSFLHATHTSMAVT
jgi:hypothetical protein